MDMKNRTSAVIIFLLLIGGFPTVKAQYVLKKADAAFELFNYASAIKFYEKAYQKKKSLHATSRLAESYRMVKDYEQQNVGMGY
jgi:peptidoglycan-associated lipoprotein